MKWKWNQHIISYSRKYWFYSQEGLLVAYVWEDGAAAIAMDGLGWIELHLDSAEEAMQQIEEAFDEVG